MTISQMKEVDNLMMGHYQISLVQMMENAGRNLARLASIIFLEERAKEKNLVVLAGVGGNGGGALVAARFLHTWGANVTILYSERQDKRNPVTNKQSIILNKMNVKSYIINSLPQQFDIESFDLILDGVLGYGIKGAPEGNTAKLIQWANDNPSRVLALDTPSGLDLDTGTRSNPTTNADATLTIALPKKGLYEKGAADNVGDLYLADIGVPYYLYQELSQPVELTQLFDHGAILKLTP